MDRRLELQHLLEDILGSSNVYFQPPNNIRMTYPCIVYALSNDQRLHADNHIYHRRKRYDVTVISRDPDDPLPDTVSNLQYSSFDRRFIADGLTHDTFTIYY